MIEVSKMQKFIDDLTVRPESFQLKEIISLLQDLELPVPVRAALQVFSDQWNYLEEELVHIDTTDREDIEDYVDEFQRLVRNLEALKAIVEAVPEESEAVDAGIQKIERCLGDDLKILVADQDNAVVAFRDFWPRFVEFADYLSELSYSELQRASEDFHSLEDALNELAGKEEMNSRLNQEEIVERYLVQSLDRICDLLRHPNAEHAASSLLSSVQCFGVERLPAIFSSYQWLLDITGITPDPEEDEDEEYVEVDWNGYQERYDAFLTLLEQIPCGFMKWETVAEMVSDNHFTSYTYNFSPASEVVKKVLFIGETLDEEFPITPDRLQHYTQTIILFDIRMTSSSSSDFGKIDATLQRALGRDCGSSFEERISFIEELNDELRK